MPVVEIQCVPRGYENDQGTTEYGAVEHDLEVIPDAQQTRAPA